MKRRFSHNLQNLRFSYRAIFFSKKKNPCQLIASSKNLYESSQPNPFEKSERERRYWVTLRICKQKHFASRFSLTTSFASLIHHIHSCPLAMLSKKLCWASKREREKQSTRERGRGKYCDVINFSLKEEHRKKIVCYIYLLNIFSYVFIVENLFFVCVFVRKNARASQSVWDNFFIYITSLYNSLERN